MKRDEQRRVHGGSAIRSSVGLPVVVLTVLVMAVSGAAGAGWRVFRPCVAQETSPGDSSNQGERFPDDRLPGGPIESSLKPVNPPQISIQPSDAGSTIFTNPEPHSREPLPMVPHVLWAVGGSSSTLALRPIESVLRSRTIGGYTILPTVSDLSCGEPVGSSALADLTPLVNRYPDRFSEIRRKTQQKQAENRVASVSSQADVVKNAGRLAGRLVNPPTNTGMRYAGTSVRNQVVVPTVRSYVSHGNVKPTGVISSSGFSNFPLRAPATEEGAANGGASANVVWMRDLRNSAQLPLTPMPLTPMPPEPAATPDAVNADENAVESVAPEHPVTIGRSEAEEDPAARIAYRIAGDVGVRRTAPMHVFVAGTTVTLQGAVLTSADQALAESLAAAEPGIREVRNLLHITGP